MGANEFVVKSKGKTAAEAFEVAVEQAAYDYGHAGYTGTIAEKSEFVKIKCPDDVDPMKYADQLMSEGDDRIDDKWGPAGCIQDPKDKNTFIFFGWASS